MSMKCEVIQDLLPLYIDEVCSQESREMIEQHLNDCDSCQKYLQKLKTEVPGVDKEATIQKAAYLKDIKKKILFKNVKVSIISAILALGIGFGSYFVLTKVETQIPYEPGLFTIEVDEQGEFEVFFEGHAYSESYLADRVVIENDVQKRIIFMSLEDTLWTRHFSTKNDSWIISSEKPFWHRDEIEHTEIYYVPTNFHMRDDLFNHNAISDEEFLEQIRDIGTLIWKR